MSKIQLINDYCQSDYTFLMDIIFIGLLCFGHFEMTKTREPVFNCAAISI